MVTRVDHRCYCEQTISMDERQHGFRGPPGVLVCASAGLLYFKSKRKFCHHTIPRPYLSHYTIHFPFIGKESLGVSLEDTALTRVRERERWREMLGSYLIKRCFFFPFESATFARKERDREKKGTKTHFILEVAVREKYFFWTTQRPPFAEARPSRVF